MKTAISGRGTACSEMRSQDVIYLGIKEDVEEEAEDVGASRQ